MRHSRAHHIAPKIIIACLCGVVSVHAKAAQDFCEALSKFARGLGTGESREVTLFTEWSAEPTRACRYDSRTAAGRKFCDWLGENAVIEYMEINVRNAIECFTGNDASNFPVGTSLSGKRRLNGVGLGRRLVDVELEYSVRSGASPDLLRILVTGRGE